MKASEIKKLCEKHGFKLMRSKKHFIWHHPSGAVMTTSKSASDQRAFANIDKQARKAISQASQSHKQH
jgi:predicted RNA binding protein YcfA (HicA-like mRNA interferase family)